MTENSSHRKAVKKCKPTLTSTLAVLALLAVALWRGGTVAWRLVVVTSTVLGWLMVAHAAPIATSLTSTAAITASSLSTNLWRVVARGLRAAVIAADGEMERLKVLKKRKKRRNISMKALQMLHCPLLEEKLQNFS